MTLIPRQLSMDTAAASQVPATSPGVDKAWQLAMQKAQARQWFHGMADRGRPASVGGPAPQAAGEAPLASGGQAAPRGDVPAAVAHAPEPLESFAPAMDVRFAAAAAGTEMSPSVRAAGLARAPTPAAIAPVVKPQRPAVLAGTQVPGTASRTALPEASPPAGVRVHVEELAGGLQVWVGIPGDAAAVSARAQVLLADLRRQCAGTGQRLDKLVCNGEVLFEHAPSPPTQEP